jgi:hypothetical protein
MNDRAEIQVSIGVLIIPALILLTGIGWIVSPRDGEGHPLLLLPDVKRMEAYHRKVLSWDQELHLLDGEIAAVLAGTSLDLFDHSRQAQNAVERALRIVREIDQTETPAPLSGLRQELDQVSIAYLEAARLSLVWISTPKPENRASVEQKLEEARAGLTRVEANQWLVKTSP